MRKISKGQTQGLLLQAIIPTLIWALHPVQIESVLLSLNIAPVTGYFICFILFYDFLKNKNPPILKRWMLGIFILLIPLVLHEYITILPLVFFVFSLLESLKSTSIVQSFKTAYNNTSHYLFGILAYTIFFFFSHYRFNLPTTYNMETILERFFWLSPQIFFHNIKLIFFPKILSIDQTAHIKLSHSLFNNYSVFCFLFLACLLFLPLAIFLWKKRFYSLTLTAWLFLISMLPFLQILTPTYSLAGERYLYFPLFILMFGLLQIFQCRALPWQAPTRIVLLILLVVYSSRAYIRTLDWKNNETFLLSTISTSSNELYKGSRMLDFTNVVNNTQDIRTKAKEYLNEAMLRL